MARFDNPATGAWNAGQPFGTRKFLNFPADRPIALDSGKTLQDVTIAYETWGELNAEKSNAILLCHLADVAKQDPLNLDSRRVNLCRQQTICLCRSHNPTQRDPPTNLELANLLRRFLLHASHPSMRDTTKLHSIFQY